MRVGIIAGLGALMLGGCELLTGDNPHNDVMLFVTGTKVALDVSAPALNGAIPEFTLGYKRMEGVWMPLNVNGDSASNADIDAKIAALQDCDSRAAAAIADAGTRQAFCLSEVFGSGKYVSMSSGINPDTGGSEYEIDTYSVFASFGARGGLSSEAAEGGLAQFFATGIAAQRLGANPAIGDALTARGSKAAEENIRNSSTDPVQTLIDRGVDPDEAQRIVGAGMVAQATRNQNVETVRTCLADSTKQATVFGDNDVKASMGNAPFTADDLLRRLSRPNNDDLMNKVLELCGEGNDV